MHFKVLHGVPEGVSRTSRRFQWAPGGARGCGGLRRLRITSGGHPKVTVSVDT